MQGQKFNMVKNLRKNDVILCILNFTRSKWICMYVCVCVCVCVCVFVCLWVVIIESWLRMAEGGCCFGKHTFHSTCATRGS
jgi:hypothetical protein